MPLTKIKKDKRGHKKKGIQDKPLKKFGSSKNEGKFESRNFKVNW